MKSLFSTAIAASLCVSMMAAPGFTRVAHAQAPAADAMTQARQHFARGVKLYEEEDYRAALIEFKRAYELVPNSAVLYNIGQSHYQLREYAFALKTLETFMKQGGDDVTKDKRAQVEREVEELRGRVAHVTVTTSVEGSDVTLDDAPLGKTPFADAHLIGAGRHTLAASHAGYRSVSKVVDIAGGDTLTIALDLGDAEATKSAPVSASAPSPEEKPSYAPAIVTGIVGVGGIVAGTFFGVSAMSNKSSLDANCVNKVCPASAQKDIDGFTRNGTLSTIAFAVGALGLGASLFFFVRAKNDEPKTSAVNVEPYLGLGSAGVTGRF